MVEDPLTLAIRPPLDETPEEKTVREQKERNAKAISDAIDQSIKQERQVSGVPQHSSTTLILFFFVFF